MILRLGRIHVDAVFVADRPCSTQISGKGETREYCCPDSSTAAVLNLTEVSWTADIDHQSEDKIVVDVGKSSGSSLDV
ncbi:hypothetical protein GCM10027068_45860 [Prescottella soli]